MAYHFHTSDFEAWAYTIKEHEAYLAAVTQAQVRPVHSYSCQHILWEDDGSYIVFDEGSYEPLTDWVGAPIVCTIPASLRDEL
jgi:uncharacterized protein YpuA (DUF1002 family)